MENNFKKSLFTKFIVIISLLLISVGVSYLLYKKIKTIEGKEIINSSEITIEKPVWHPSSESLVFHKGGYLVQRNINTLETSKILEEKIGNGSFDFFGKNKMVYIAEYWDGSGKYIVSMENIKKTRLEIKSLDLVNKKTEVIFSLSGVGDNIDFSDVKYSTNGQKILFKVYARDYSNLSIHFNEIKLHIDNVLSNYNMKNSGWYTIDADGKNLRNVDFCEIDLREDGTPVLDDNYLYFGDHKRCDIENKVVERGVSSDRITNLFSKNIFFKDSNIEKYGYIMMSPDGKKYVRKLGHLGWEKRSNYYTVKKVKE